MKIGGNFPVIPQSGTPKSNHNLPIVSSEYSQTGSQEQAMMPSRVQAFEQASAAESSRFFKMEGLNGLAQQAIAAYQSTESLSPNNPRNQLIGIDVYA